MLIDPFTIIAQILNFAILVFALKYFLYDRVIGAMDEREASIAARLHDAEEREADAATEAEQYRDQRRALDDQRQELLDDARSEADRHRRQLMDEARAAVDHERRRWEYALKAEQRELEHELQRRTAHEVVELTRGALSDLAGTDLETVVLEQALDRLSADAAASSGLFGETTARAPVTVRTAFSVDRGRRELVRDRLRSIGLGPDRQVHFEQDPDLILGVELQSAGHAVSWHAHDYLERFEATVQTLIDADDLSDVG